MSDLGAVAVSSLTEELSLGPKQETMMATATLSYDFRNASSNAYPKVSDVLTKSTRWDRGQSGSTYIGDGSVRDLLADVAKCFNMIESEGLDPSMVTFVLVQAK